MNEVTQGIDVPARLYIGERCQCRNLQALAVALGVTQTP